MGYNLQCYSVKREEKVLGVDVYLTTPNEDAVRQGTANPIEDIGYSRFVMTLVDKTKGKTVYPFGNIPASEISYIKSIKDLALQQKVLGSLAQTPSTDIGHNRPAGAYTATFQFGRNRGKTVVDILQDPAGGLQALQKEREFLLEKVNQFPKNQLLIDDIDRITNEVKNGTFRPQDVGKSAPASPGTRQITIYEQNYKFLNSRKDQEGRPLVYAIKMTFDQSMKYSWEVSIRNGYAPVHKTAKGGANIQASEIVGITQSSMKMTDVEFCSLIDKMYDCYRDFCTCTFRQQYALAKAMADADKERGRAARNTPDAGQEDLPTYGRQCAAQRGAEAWRNGEQTAGQSWMNGRGSVGRRAYENTA